MQLIDGPTIPMLARKLRVNVRTMFRRLIKLHGVDRANGGEDFVPWLYRYEGGTWRVNLPRLRRSHPELFSVASNEELDTRLKRVEMQVEALDTSHRGLVRRVNKMAPV